MNQINSNLADIGPALARARASTLLLLCSAFPAWRASPETPLFAVGRPLRTSDMEHAAVLRDRPRTADSRWLLVGLLVTVHWIVAYGARIHNVFVRVDTPAFKRFQ